MANPNHGSQSQFAQTQAVRPKPVRTLRVTEEGLDDFLSGNSNVFAPGPDTYIPSGIDEHGVHVPQQDKGNGGFFFPGFGTGGNHVGRNLKNKQQPERPIDLAGPNPQRARKFLGDEFQGMLTFDRKGKPTFHSRFPQAANSPADIKEYRLSIATKLPEFMTTDTPQAHDIDDMKDEAFDGASFKDVFRRIDAKTLKQVQHYAAQFEAAYGIKLTVGFDLPDAELTLMGYNKGDPNLLGFAAFPPGINDWADMKGLGHHPAYMCLNNQYTKTASAKECYDLFSHEFGHTLGLAHPHDLGILNMTRREALSATKMSYTDLKLEAFRHVVADADGKPITKGNRKQYFSVGPDEGVLDYGFRKWTGEAPVLGTVSNPNPNDPNNDLYKGVYDLEAHHKRALTQNASSLVFQREKMLPMVPMLNDGKHTVLKGSHGDDFIDTNPGYASTLIDLKSGAVQRFALVEGHMEKVMGIAGNNVIVAAQHGNQEILPGTGKNQIQLLYPDLTGSKKIISEGQDTLVLTEELLAKQKFTARAKQGGINLRTKEGVEIFLGGEGVKFIQVINDRGRNLFQMDVSGLSASELNTAIFRDNAWKKVVDLPKEAQPVAPVETIRNPVMTDEKLGKWTRGIAEERAQPSPQTGTIARR